MLHEDQELTETCERLFSLGKEVLNSSSTVKNNNKHECSNKRVKNSNKSVKDINKIVKDSNKTVTDPNKVVKDFNKSVNNEKNKLRNHTQYKSVSKLNKYQSRTERKITKITVGSSQTDESNKLDSHTRRKTVEKRNKFCKKVSKSVDQRRDLVNKLQKVSDEDIRGVQSMINHIDRLLKRNIKFRDVIPLKKCKLNCILRIQQKIKKNLRRTFFVNYESKGLKPLSEKRQRLHEQLHLARLALKTWIKDHKIFCQVEHLSKETCVVCAFPEIKYLDISRILSNE